MAPRKKDPQIIEILPSYREHERKYLPQVPPRSKQAEILRIVDHIRRSPDVFVTPDHPDLAPVLPQGMKIRFRPAEELTRPRQRIYFADSDLKVRDLCAEFRQETDFAYGVKQTVKVGNGASSSDSTLSRAEEQAKLRWLGVNLKAVHDKRLKKWLERHFDQKNLKPAFRLVSQRIRIPYFPEGDTSVLIELSADFILCGETAFGRTWSDPKIEIELVKGADDDTGARKILKAEEKRLLSLFRLTPQLESNAVVGYSHLAGDLSIKAGRRAFEGLKPDEIWWTRSSGRRLTPQI